jgi:hypothetical protein
MSLCFPVMYPPRHPLPVQHQFTQGVPANPWPPAHPLNPNPRKPTSKPYPLPSPNIHPHLSVATCSQREPPHRGSISPRRDREVPRSKQNSGNIHLITVLTGNLPPIDKKRHTWSHNSPSYWPTSSSPWACAFSESHSGSQSSNPCTYGNERKRPGTPPVNTSLYFPASRIE